MNAQGADSVPGGARDLDGAKATQASSFVDSLSQLRSAQKSSRGAPIYSVLVNRPMGRVFAALAHQIGLTPNQVTAISAVFTFSGVALIALAPASVLTGLGVAVLLVLGYGLDAADGQLARLRGGGSLLGEWLDHLTDSVKVVVLHLAVAVSWFRFYDVSPGWLLVPLAFAAASSVHFFGMILVDQLARVRHASTGAGVAPPKVMGRLNSYAKLPTDYGVLALSFALLGWHTGFLVIYTLLALAMVGYTVLVAQKWRRDVVALEQPQQNAALSSL